jgi:hypothetical protein
LAAHECCGEEVLYRIVVIAASLQDERRTLLDAISVAVTFSTSRIGEMVRARTCQCALRIERLAGQLFHALLVASGPVGSKCATVR